MYIPRKIEKKLHDYLKDDKVVILLGARQVGKTTLVEPFVKEKGGAYFNCDLEVDKSRLVAAGSLSPQEAMTYLGDPELIVIDEAQNLPEIGRIVKGWYDAKVKAKIVLLGSSSLNLLDQTAEPLTGRNEKLYLTPFLYTEILENQSWYSSNFTPQMLKGNFYNQIQTLLLERMVFGSYPEAVTTADKERYLINLTSDYLLRDVLQNGLVKSPEPIKRLLALLAHQAGSEISVDGLANQLNLARQTVENYLELLERSYVIFRLQAFSTNLRKEITRSTKIFFWDTGIRNALLKEFSLSQYRSDIGLLFENWVVAEVAKRNLMLHGGKYDLRFWRRSEGAEVDLIVRGTDTFKAYEIKWNKKNPTASMRSFTNAYDIPVEVITRETLFDHLDIFG